MAGQGTPKAMIRPDCTEKATSYNELLQIASKPGRKDPFIKFLQSIPEGTMQNFTFVYKSESEQLKGISAQFPRTIRSTQDGALTIAYSCDPKSPAYGDVQIIRKDPATKRLLFSQIDFRSQPPTVTENPASCVECHSARKDASRMKFNWPNYPHWPGFYGSDDDRFPASTDESKKYQTFRKEQGNNPCYANLPWPKDSKLSEKPLYPFTANASSDIPPFSRRPNARMGITFLRQQLDQELAILSDDPRWEALKSLILFNELSCDSRSPAPGKYVEDAASRKPFKDLVSTVFPDLADPYSYDVIRALGMEDALDLRFRAAGGPIDPSPYRDGIHPSHRYLMGRAALAVAEKNLKLDVLKAKVENYLSEPDSIKDTLDRPYSCYFADANAIASNFAADPATEPDSPLCLALLEQGKLDVARYRDLVRASIGKDTTPQTDPCHPTNENPISVAKAQALRLISAASAGDDQPLVIRRLRRGEAMYRTCNECHGDRLLLNWKIESHRKKVKTRLTLNSDDRMPPEPRAKLSDEDQASLISYMDFLSGTSSDAK